MVCWKCQISGEESAKTVRYWGMVRAGHGGAGTERLDPGFDPRH